MTQEMAQAFAGQFRQAGADIVKVESFRAPARPGGRDYGVAVFCPEGVAVPQSLRAYGCSPEVASVWNSGPACDLLGFLQQVCLGL